MTAPACPNCGSDSSPSYHVQDYNRRIGSAKFRYYRCKKCRLLFLDPIPDDLSSYYPEDYYPFAPSRDELATIAEGERYKLDLVQRFVKQGSLVEIGPGAGGFAFLARKAGFSVRVIEMSAESCDFLRDTVGVKAVCTTDETEALRNGEPADVIALWHVVEHLRDPFALVRAAATKLNPGGILVMAAPNPDAMQFKILQGRWTHLDAPRHVRLIPREALIDVARDAGLSLALQTTTDAGSIGWNQFGWEHSISNMFRRARPRAYGFRAGRLVSQILRPIERREGRGSAYTLIFERPV